MSGTSYKPVEIPQLRMQTLSSGAAGFIFATQPAWTTVYSLKVEVPTKWLISFPLIENLDWLSLSMTPRSEIDPKEVTHVAIIGTTVGAFSALPGEHWQGVVPRSQVGHPLAHALHDAEKQFHLLNTIYIRMLRSNKLRLMAKWSQHPISLSIEKKIAQKVSHTLQLHDQISEEIRVSAPATLMKKLHFNEEMR